MRERFVSSTKLPYQLAPDKTTLKLPGILLKLPYQLDMIRGILIKVPCEQHVLHRCTSCTAARARAPYAEQHFPAAFTR